MHGRFWKPETVVSDMQKAKTSAGRFIFNMDEWLTTGQVRSYFSRMKLTTMKKIDPLSSRASKQTTFIDNKDEDEEEEGLDEEANAEVDTVVSI